MNSYFHSQAAGENKRRRTRGLLIDTAIDIFSKKGIEAASIQEITTSAGLANGTFYNHFRDKDELAGCVSEAIVLEIGRHLVDEMTDLDKGAVRVAVVSMGVALVRGVRPLSFSWFSRVVFSWFSYRAID